MHVQPRHPVEELKKLRRAKRYQPIADRLQMVILAMGGQTAPQISDAVGLSRRQVQDWVRRYNGEGIDGLWDRPRPGQPTKLPRDQEEAFKQRMLAGPTEADGGICTLRGEDARRILAEEFGAQYTLGGAIDLLHRLGFSCLRPRPQHRKNDPQAMQRWVDSAPLLSSK